MLFPFADSMKKDHIVLSLLSYQEKRWRYERSNLLGDRRLFLLEIFGHLGLVYLILGLLRGESYSYLERSESKGNVLKMMFRYI